MSLGSWKPTGDSSVHTQIEMDVEPILHHIKKQTEEGTETKNVRFLNYFSKALGEAVASNPEVNSIVRFGKIYPRKDVDIFFHVLSSMKNIDDLSGVVIRRVDKKTVVEIADEFSEKITAVRKGTDKTYDQVKKVFAIAPGFLSKAILKLTSFISYTLNLHSPLLGVPKDSFGSIMLTNIGSFGGDNAFAPIAPHTNIPMVVSLGAIKKRPYVLDDELVVRQTVKVGFVFDHRICDGIHVQKIIRDLRKNLKAMIHEQE